MKQPYHDMNSKTLHDQRKVASLGTQLILNDNFDTEIILTSNEAKRFVDYPIKLNSTMTFFFCLEGSADVHEGMQEYHMTKNDVSFCKSGLFGEFNGMSEDAKFILIIANEDFYFPIINTVDSSALQRLLIAHPICHLSDNEMIDILTIYNLMKERINNFSENPFLYEYVKGLVQALFFSVYSAYTLAARRKERERQKISRQQDIFNRFIETVQKYYTQERDIKFYADLLCITPKYLSQVVYKTSGYHAGEHIDHFVIAEAKLLVRSRNYSIMQISEMLNFASQSYFGRYFKKATGYSPLQYQELE